MPSRDTKVITMRVPNEEYYKWLELAAKNKQPISTYMKSAINGYISSNVIDTNKIFAEKGAFLDSPPVVLKISKPIWTKEIPKPNDWDSFIDDGRSADEMWCRERNNSLRSNRPKFLFGTRIEKYLFDTEKGIVLEKR